MGVSSVSSPISISFFILTILLNLLHNTNSASSPSTDYTTLVYKGCSKQPLSDPTGQYAQSLSTLFSSLLQAASKARYYKSTAGSGQTSVSGLFQCRGDLSGGDCYKCISKMPQLADQLCQGKVEAARIQLLGCYFLYEVSGFTQISGYELLYKTCSPNHVAGSGFGMRRDSALNAMVTGVAGSGFYATSYEQVYVMGQCEGDLSSADCSQCARSAAQRAQSECGGALSGQVYLHKCFISYTYYPNGVPRGGGGGGGSSGGSSFSSGQNTGKTVAIIVGGIAGVGFLIVCAMFVKGWKKKDDDY